MNIVAGVDGSPGSREALRWALAEARLRQTPLQVVYAWEFPHLPVGPGIAPPITADTVSRLREAAEDVLDTALAETGDELEGVEIRRAVVEGPAASVLVEAAEGADLLVVGSRGLGGFRGLLLGSVSQQCAHHASCPVVIVRAPRGD